MKINIWPERRQNTKVQILFCFKTSLNLEFVLLFFTFTCSWGFFFEWVCMGQGVICASCLAVPLGKDILSRTRNKPKKIWTPWSCQHIPLRQKFLKHSALSKNNNSTRTVSRWRGFWLRMCAWRSTVYSSCSQPLKSPREFLPENFETLSCFGKMSACLPTVDLFIRDTNTLKLNLFKVSFECWQRNPGKTNSWVSVQCKRYVWLRKVSSAQQDSFPFSSCGSRLSKFFKYENQRYFSKWNSKTRHRTHSSGKTSLLIQE